MKKWKFAIVHAGPGITGFVRLLAQKPAFALRLLKARFLYFCCRKFGRPISTPDNFVIETPNELISYWSFFVERESWNREWVRALASASRPLVVDVGANAGLFSHWIWVMRPDVELIAFDPLPRMTEKISRWHERTGARMTVHNKAVADKAGTAEFFASSENDTSASLIDHGGKTMLLSVPTVSLDEALLDKPVLLLKVDVEGGECAVLEGAKRVLANTQFLILEAHTAGALDRIKRLLGSSWRCQRVGGSDYLFTAGSEAK